MPIRRDTPYTHFTTWVEFRSPHLVLIIDLDTSLTNMERAPPSYHISSYYPLPQMVPASINLHNQYIPVASPYPESAYLPTWQSLTDTSTMVEKTAANGTIPKPSVPERKMTSEYTSKSPEFRKRRQSSKASNAIFDLDTSLSVSQKRRYQSRWLYWIYLHRNSGPVLL